MTNPAFQFDEYTVRPVNEKDREYLDLLIASDPLHWDCMDADFFLKIAPGEEAWAIEDGKGKVCLYFKTSLAVRLALLFANQTSNVANRDLLTKGLEWMEVILMRNKFREILFDTQGPALYAMARRRLGFREAQKGTLVKSLPVPGAVCPAPVATESVAGHWHHRPTSSQEAG